jgi:hypothetical protein
LCRDEDGDRRSRTGAENEEAHMDSSTWNGNSMPMADTPMDFVMAEPAALKQTEVEAQEQSEG